MYLRSGVRGGNSPDGRKVKSTIHWVSATHAVPATVRLYENIVDEEKGVYNEDGSLNLNPNSLTVLKNCMVEENLAGAKGLRQFPVCTPGILLCGCKGFDAGAAGVQPHCVTEEFIQAANCVGRGPRFRRNRYEFIIRFGKIWFKGRGYHESFAEEKKEVVGEDGIKQEHGCQQKTAFFWTRLCAVQCATRYLRQR